MTGRREFDLEERTIQFAKDVLAYTKRKRPEIGTNTTSQLSRCSTSIAANYMEASVSESNKDFRHKCAIGAKEAKESWFWLRLVGSESRAEDMRLIQEALELTKIFSSMRHFKK